MKYSTIIISIYVVLSIIGCNSGNKPSETTKNKSEEEIKVSYVYKNNEQTKNIKQKGNLIVKLAATELGSALKNTIKEEGAEKAILFCNHNAMKITDSLATAENVKIRRIAIKNRNPKNEVNTDESEIFTKYLKEWKDGKTLESKIAIDNNGHPVYYKPIIMVKKCLTCHGKRGETMPENIATKITELYPNDRAIDFKDGDPRGMWAITFNKIKIGE